MRAVTDHSDPAFIQALSRSTEVYFDVGAVAVEQLLTIYRRRARRLATLDRPLVAAAVHHLLHVLEDSGLQEVQMVQLKADDDQSGLWLFDGESGNVLCTLAGPALPSWDEQSRG